MSRRWIAMLALVCSSGCGMSPEEEACNDVVDALAGVVERCGSQAEADAFREQVMSRFNDCQVKAIRDEASLRSQCLPAIEKAKCEAVLSGDDSWFPESCKGQLLL